MIQVTSDMSNVSIMSSAEQYFRAGVLKVNTSTYVKIVIYADIYSTGEDRHLSWSGTARSYSSWLSCRLLAPPLLDSKGRLLVLKLITIHETGFRQ